MAIRVKAVERNISFENGVKKYAFVMQPELYSKLTESKVINETAMRAGIGRGTIKAAWDAIGDIVKQVTSGDSSTVEDPDSTDPDNGTSGGGGSDGNTDENPLG